MFSTFLAFFSITSQVTLEYLQKARGLTAGQRLWADWLAWGFLFFLTRINLRATASEYRTVDSEKLGDSCDPQPRRYTNTARSSSLTILAFLFVGVQIITYHAGEHLKWATPLLTVSTFATSILLGQAKSSIGLFDNEFLLSWQACIPRCLGSSLVRALPTLVFLGLSVVSASAFASSPPPTTSSSLMTGAVFLLLATAMYTLLGEQTEASPFHRVGLSDTHRSVLRPLALRVFALWTLYFAVVDSEALKPHALTLVAGILRLFQPYAVTVLTSEGASLAATTITTSSVAIAISMGTKSSTTAATAGLIAASSLLQTISTLPKSATYSTWLLAFLLLPMLSVLNLHGLIHLGQVHSFSTASMYSTTHPIEELVTAGNLHFEELLARQSNTLEEAIKEYERRYHRKPPPKFDKWYDMAQANDFLLIDEFDTIMASIEPFWGVPAHALQARIKAISAAPNMIHFSIRNGTATWEPDHYHASMLGEWVGKYQTADILPDMDLKINVLDEPRVVAPYDTVAAAAQRARAQISLKTLQGDADVDWLSVGQQDSWAVMLTSCSIGSPARREYFDEIPPELPGLLPFVVNVTASKDVCASVDMRHQHGFFDSPDTLRITHSFVPILSQCAPSIFNDILYPTPYYAHKMVDDKLDDDDKETWEQKLDQLYWAGKATGGHSNTKNWMGMHRQRLALMTAPDSTMLVGLLRRARAGGAWRSYQTTWAKIANLFHLRVTGTAQCEPEACAQMESRFSPEEDTMSASMGSKYAIDIDGNSFSGRFYRLLKSKSCVLKLTVFREWHDDRLVPWVHYIPVSVGAEELGEIMRFLVQEETGKKIGRKIAEVGRDWAKKLLRRVDLEVAFFRVLIEYGRLVDSEREGMF